MPRKGGKKKKGRVIKPGFEQAAIAQKFNDKLQDKLGSLGGLGAAATPPVVVASRLLSRYALTAAKSALVLPYFFFFLMLGRILTKFFSSLMSTMW